MSAESCADKAARRATTRLFRRLLGDPQSAAITVKLPRRDPARRATYLAINSEANRLLGSGTYRLQQQAGYLIVRRKLP